jgi:hypothetical protein
MSDLAIAEVPMTNLLLGWIMLLLGVLSGIGMGLFFARDRWLGGYGSYPRRMLRLGHIACFGLGFLNIAFALTLTALSLEAGVLLTSASAGFALAAVTMPLCCFLAAWRKPFRHLFPIPVSGALAGILFILMGGLAS